VTLDPKNVTAQLQHRAAGNPPSTLPDSAISNCFPGLEFDFRNLWRRLFEGIQLHEADNYVVAADGAHRHLVGGRLLKVGDDPMVVEVRGPRTAGGPDELLRPAAPMEWSNAMAAVLRAHAGEMVDCHFTEGPAPEAVGLDGTPLHTEQLRINRLFADGAAVIEESLVEPGELTMSLCSPWQNDYRECACYYWAASRPDYVNVESEADGSSSGLNWLAKDRAGRSYEVDRNQATLVNYDELFQDWQAVLHFIVGGRDYD
jgi:hypothetical protein